MTRLGAQQVTKHYTLGRGELYFDRFVDLTVDYSTEGERYIGNTPEFSLTISQQTLDHFSSDHGIREKDESVPLQVDRTGSFTTDEINVDNVAAFFFGATEEVTEAGGAEQSVFLNVKKGRYYQLGTTDARPMGVRGVLGETDDSNSAGGFALYAYSDSNSINPVLDSNSGNVAYTAGTDYILDADLGRVFIPLTSSIADGADLIAAFTVKASTHNRVTSGSEPVAGTLRFIAFNPQGADIDYFMPYVKISPNGDYGLKSDEWQTIPFNLEILLRGDFAAIYAGDTPAFT